MKILPIVEIYEVPSCISINILTHMEMYPDRAVDCDPLQHGDVVSSSQGVTESRSLRGENISVKMISLVDERHHYSDVKRVLWREMCLHHRLVPRGAPRTRPT